MNLNVNKYFVEVAAVGFLHYVVVLGAGYFQQDEFKGRSFR